jgi:hypothetical protein
VQEEEGEVSRFTFVIQIHPHGISTLENLSTQERIRLGELAEIGPCIERWMAELARPEPAESRPPKH